MHQNSLHNVWAASEEGEKCESWHKIGIKSVCGGKINSFWKWWSEWPNEMKWHRWKVGKKNNKIAALQESLWSHGVDSCLLEVTKNTEIKEIEIVESRSIYIIPQKHFQRQRFQPCKQWIPNFNMTPFLLQLSSDDILNFGWNGQLCSSGSKQFKCWARLRQKRKDNLTIDCMGQRWRN